MKLRLCWFAVLGMLLVHLAEADENSDLELIPNTTVPNSSDTKIKDNRQRIYLQNVLTLDSLRQALNVPATALPFNWQERWFIDLRTEWAIAERLNLSLSDRFNFRAENDISFANQENIINNFREGFLSWEPLQNLYLDAGRINLKSGVAAGYNPSDFFKSRAVVIPLSSDPSILREDRLGTVMLRAQQIRTGGTMMAVFSPKLAQPSPVYQNTDLRSLDPSLDRTNANQRFLLKGSVDLGEDFSPELLLYQQDSRSSIAVNLTKSIGQSLVTYVEWAGGQRSSLANQALQYGRQTGSLSANAPNPFAVDGRQSFQHDLSIGGSYTTANKISFNLEYHFHQAGFSRQDWNNWFTADSGKSNAAAAELWFIRSYAQEQQEPMTKHSAVLRADWVDAMLPNLQLTGFINTDLYDMSSLVQLTADYYLSNAWTIGALATTNLGQNHSDFGSLPQAASVFFKVARYF
jgi:hypothetical protein